MRKPTFPKQEINSPTPLSHFSSIIALNLNSCTPNSQSTKQQQQWQTKNPHSTALLFTLLSQITLRTKKHFTPLTP